MKTYSSKKDANNAAVLSLTDFMRIRNTLVPASNDDDDRKKFDSTLKTISQNKQKNWPDSIEMAKTNKLESRKKVFFEKEMEKRRIDEEERRYQEMQKKLVVERAQKLLFDAQDPVKSFHSKLLMADVLKERDYQDEIKIKKQEMNHRVEQKYLDMAHENMVEYDRKVNAKIEDEKAKKAEQQSYIKQQLHDSKIRRIRDYQDRVIEGEMIKLQAQDAVEKER